jgi:threonine/homoserine/homoserine lactone efflux protein
MAIDPDTLGFVGVAAIVVITPGPDMALVTTHALTRGPREARAAAIGVNAGILVHAAAAAIGLSALLVASSVAFTAVKVAGAAFLIYLGVRMLWDLRRRDDDRAEMASRIASTKLASSPFWQGFWSNVLNPKVVLLFLSLLPQFIDEGDPVVARTLLYAGLFLAMGVAWLLTYAALVGRLASTFRSPKVRRRLEVISGTVLIALGVRVALQE